MTKREGAIISAYTGNLCCKFDDMHQYIEKILKRPVMTHELANEAIVEDIKIKSKADFMKLIENQK